MKNRNVSGLPFHDVMLIENLPKSASLPVATVQQAKARLMDGRWDFDFIFLRNLIRFGNFDFIFYSFIFLFFLYQQI